MMSKDCSERIQTIRDEMARGVSLARIARDIGIRYDVLWRMVQRGFTPAIHYQEMIDRWAARKKTTNTAGAGSPSPETEKSE